MKTIIRNLYFFLAIAFPSFCSAAVLVGIGKADITPPVGTPSAGYTDRKGEGMLGVHDQLSAIALFIDNGEKQIVLCSVDHLGFTYEMAQEIRRQAHCLPNLEQCEVYIGSSHTHSGGGAFLDIPLIGESLAGPYDPNITMFYVERTVEAIAEASQNAAPSKIGIGYGFAKELSKYRGLWPKDISPQSDVSVIKVTDLEGIPRAVLFNYAVHPTVLKSQNRLFSSDFVGYARDYLQVLLGTNVQPIYFNGAQGDIIPKIFNEEDRFDSCDKLGQALAESVQQICENVETSDALHIQTECLPYSFKPQATPFGLNLPLEEYKSEMNVIVFNHQHAFLTIPGELSTIYDHQLKEIGLNLGYSQVSIFGLTNDAHGYIILPESWENKTLESGLSFGGLNYGEIIKFRAEELLKHNAPN